MKTVPQPQPLPRPENMVVAVQNFPPACYLMYLKQVDDIPAETKVPILGMNKRTRNLYTPGPIPLDFRQTEQDGDYENEIWFGDIPPRMTEINPDEYPPKTFMIITPDAKEESLPAFEKKKRGCKIIKHWATIDREYEQAQESARLTITPEPEPVLGSKGQYRIGFTEDDYQPLKTA